MDKNIKVLKDTNNNKIYPVTFSEAIYMNDGSRLEDNIDYLKEKSLEIGTLSRLQTNNKSTLVGAINEILAHETKPQYGVRFEGSNPYGTRLGQAVNKVTYTAVGIEDANYDFNDFDNLYPWSEIRRCLLDKDGNVYAYEGEPNFDADTTEYDVMVEIPKFYQKYIVNEQDNYIEYWITSTMLDDYELNPAFKTQMGSELEKIYIGAFEASSDNNVLFSRANRLPGLNTFQSELRTRAERKGSGWKMMDLYERNIIEFLFVVEYATLNTQSAILGNSDGQYSRTGITNTIDVHSNATIDNNLSSSFRYRFMENLWGNVWEMIDGCYIDENGNLYASMYYKNYSNVDSYHKMNMKADITNNDDYIVNMSYNKDNKFMKIPSLAGGDSSSNNRHYSDILFCRSLYFKNIMLVGGSILEDGMEIGLFATEFLDITKQKQYSSTRLCYRPDVTY